MRKKNRGLQSWDPIQSTDGSNPCPTLIHITSNYCLSCQQCSVNRS